MTLAERLAQINADAKKYMEDHPGSWCSGLTSDLDHWAGYNVYTAKELDDYLYAVEDHEAEEYDRENW